MSRRPPLFSSFDYRMIRLRKPRISTKYSNMSSIELSNRRFVDSFKVSKTYQDQSNRIVDDTGEPCVSGPTRLLYKRLPLSVVVFIYFELSP